MKIHLEQLGLTNYSNFFLQLRSSDWANIDSKLALPKIFCIRKVFSEILVTPFKFR